jgi:ubiquinone biosynthesis protein Coq4
MYYKIIKLNYQMYFLIAASINWICQYMRHTINCVQIYSKRFTSAVKDLDLHKLPEMLLSYIIAVYRTYVVLPVQSYAQ